MTVPYSNFAGYGAISAICGQEVNGYRSLKCRCTQSFIECDPTDNYAEVYICDNSNSDVVLDCGYEESIGTSYTQEAQASMAVSASVEYAIQVGLGELFSEELGYSVTTEYDWSTAKSATFDYVETYSVSTQVPARYTVSQQLWCNDYSLAIPTRCLSPPGCG